MRRPNFPPVPKPVANGSFGQADIPARGLERANLTHCSPSPRRMQCSRVSMFVDARAAYARYFGELLAKAGFAMEEIVPTSSMLSIIVGRPSG